MLFLGAGASAPFGIPTMKELVIDFENHLASGEENAKETKIYKKIKNDLKRYLGKDADLEEVFTVIESMVNFEDLNLDVFSTYLFGKYLTEVRSQFDEEETSSSLDLSIMLREFVKEKCKIPSTSFAKIAEVYKDLFNRFFYESSSFGTGDHMGKDSAASGRWPIFTTNYDTCLEYYFRKAAKLPLNTGFSPDNVTNTMVMNNDRLFESDVTRLFKLHGSVSWFVDSEGTVTEEQMIGTSLVGREYLGEMMVYPIQEKQLYLEPYITMFRQLNHELAARENWVVIGYSFNDPIILSIFLENASDQKRMIVVDPHASEFISKIDDIDISQGLKMCPIDDKFGEEDYREVNCKIMRCIKKQLKYDSSKTPP